MTVLEKQAVGGFEKQRSETGFGKYLIVGLAALVLGSAIAWGGIQSFGSETATFDASQIAEFRAAEQAELMELQWVAQVNATKGSDLVERYAQMHGARIAEIQAQRAAELVGQQSNLFAEAVRAINAQRAQDMLEFRYGLTSATD